MMRKMTKKRQQKHEKDGELVWKKRARHVISLELDRISSECAANETTKRLNGKRFIFG